MKWFEYFQGNSPMHKGGRSYKDRVFEPIARAFHTAGFTANHLTFIGLCLSIIGVSILWIDEHVFYWWFALLIGVSWLLDGVDGTLARSTKSHSRFGEAFDYYVDVFIAILLYVSVVLLFANAWWFVGLVIYLLIFLLHKLLRTGIIMFPGRSYIVVPLCFGLPIFGLVVFCTLVLFNVFTLTRFLLKSA